MHPEFAGRTCESCVTWSYDEDGQITRKPSRVGLPVRRPKGTPTPCHKCPKIPPNAPEKTREHAIEMSERTMATYRHYLECRAVGRFPRDRIVERNAAIIRAVHDEFDRMPLLRLVARLGGQV